jgi:uncharacterized protein YoxC
VTDPLFWLVLSFLFVTVSLTIVLAVAIPALRELARAARSAEKLFDTLRREFPPTLEAIRLTGLEISDLTDDVSEGVQSAGNVVKQVDQSLSTVRNQAQKVQSGTRSVMVGMKAAWRTFVRSQKPTSPRRSPDRLSSSRSDLELGMGTQPLVEKRLSNQPPLPEAMPTAQQSFISTQDGLEHVAEIANGTVSDPRESQNQIASIEQPFHRGSQSNTTPRRSHKADANDLDPISEESSRE